MPSTVNGIGTHYYGKKNVHTRPATCPHCGKAVALASYDTRLWFVIVFIPVIPLGRKRIIDQCPSCRRHYVMDLQKWETTKQLETSGALERFRSNPTADAAIEAHRQLLLFHQAAEAADLQKTMVEQFADNARVQAYLAAALVHQGRVGEAETFFARALELRPDLPEARIGVAQAHLRAGRFDEARRLLDFLEKPGAGQLYSLAPLEQLALAFQRNGRHAEALSLFERLLAEFPAIAGHKAFRKWVQHSEQALKRPQSILPKIRFSWRRLLDRKLLVSRSNPARALSLRTVLLIGGAAVVVVVLGLMIANSNIRLNRTLHVVNTIGPGLRLEIAGLGPTNLRPGVTTVALPEGHYVARFSGPIQEEVSFDLRANYFDRWFDKPAWVLNPGGTAIILQQRAVYSRNPQPGSFHLLYGRNFYQLSDIDYPFTALPEKLNVQSGSQRALTALALFPGKPLNAFLGLEQARRWQEAADLAEWHLRRHPEDKEFLQAYVASLVQSHQTARAEAFLSSGLTNRPVQTEWHRTYQDLVRTTPRVEQLLPQYEQMVRAEPTNSALLYLYGRLCGDHRRGSQFFQRACQADPSNPYPVYALAYDQVAGGNWAKAMPLLDQVVAWCPEDPQFRQDWVQACLALGQLEPAEKLLRIRLQHDPADWRSTVLLCDVLVAQEKPAAAQQAIDDLLRAIQARYPESLSQMRTALQEHYLYLVGDFTALEKAGRANPSPAGKVTLFQALLEQGRLAEAARVLPVKEVQNPMLLLAASLAGHLAGQDQEAAEWQAALLKNLQEGRGADSQRTAALLEGKVPPTRPALDEIVFPPPLKAALIADLALTHPSSRAELKAAARQLNVERSFPYHLVRRATAETTQ